MLRKPDQRPDDAITVFSDGSARRMRGGDGRSAVGAARSVVLGELGGTYQKSVVIGGRPVRKGRGNGRQGGGGGGSIWGMWLRGGDARAARRGGGGESEDEGTFLQRERSLAKNHRGKVPAAVKEARLSKVKKNTKKYRGKYNDEESSEGELEMKERSGGRGGYEPTPLPQDDYGRPVSMDINSQPTRPLSMDDFSDITSAYPFSDTTGTYDYQPPARPLQSVMGHSEISNPGPLPPSTTTYAATTTAPSSSSYAYTTTTTTDTSSSSQPSRMASYVRGDDAPAIRTPRRTREPSYTIGDDTPTSPVKRNSSYAPGDDRILSRAATKKPMGARAPTQKAKSHQSRRESRDTPPVSASPRRQSREASRSSSKPASRRQSGEMDITAAAAMSGGYVRAQSRSREQQQPFSSRPAPQSRHQSRASSPVKASSSRPSSRPNSRPTSRAPSPTKQRGPPAPPVTTTRGAYPSSSDLSSSSSEDDDSGSEMNPSEIGMGKGNKVYTHTLNQERGNRTAPAPLRYGGGMAVGGPSVQGGSLVGSESRALVPAGERGMVTVKKGYRRGSVGSLSSEGSVASSNGRSGL